MIKYPGLNKINKQRPPKNMKNEATNVASLNVSRVCVRVDRSALFCA